MKFFFVFLDTLFMKNFLLHLMLILFVGMASASPWSSIHGDRLSVIGYRSSKILSTNIDRAAYYKALESQNKALIDEQISELNATTSNGKDAFLGTMIMRKAGIGGTPSAKLKLFRHGHKLLEDAIAREPNNVEYRFLRLVIQENAPGILGYKNNKQTDSEIIRNSYYSLPDDLQKTIADYNKKSKVLKLQVS
jgi:hypothetical protein